MLYRVKISIEFETYFSVFEDFRKDCSPLTSTAPSVANLLRAKPQGVDEQRLSKSNHLRAGSCL